MNCSFIIVGSSSKTEQTDLDNPKPMHARVSRKLEDVKKKMDQQANERNRLQRENGELRSKFKQFFEQYDKREKELQEQLDTSVAGLRGSADTPAAKSGLADIEKPLREAEEAVQRVLDADAQQRSVAQDPQRSQEALVAWEQTHKEALRLVGVARACFTRKRAALRRSSPAVVAASEKELAGYQSRLDVINNSFIEAKANLTKRKQEAASGPAASRTSTASTNGISPRRAIPPPATKARRCACTCPERT